MTEEQQEAFNAVEKINEELFKKYDKKNKNDSYKDLLSSIPIVSITIASGYMFIGLSLVSTDTCQIPEKTLYNSENN